MELGEIPWSKIVDYGLYKGVDYDMLDAFVHIIREMDSAYLSWMGKESEKARQGNNTNEGAENKR